MKEPAVREAIDLGCCRVFAFALDVFDGLNSLCQHLIVGRKHLMLAGVLSGPQDPHLDGVRSYVGHENFRSGIGQDAGSFSDSLKDCSLELVQRNGLLDAEIVLPSAAVIV